MVPIIKVVADACSISFKILIYVITFWLKWQVLCDVILDRSSARSSGLQIQTTESSGTAEVQTVEAERGPNEQAECPSNVEAQAVTCNGVCEILPSDISPELKVSGYESESSTGMNSDARGEPFEDVDMIDVEPTGVTNEISCTAVESSYIPISQADKDLGDVDIGRSLEKASGRTEEKDDTDMARNGPSPGSLNGFSVSMHCQNVGEDSEHKEVVKCKVVTAKDNAYHGNGYVNANKSAVPVEDAGTLLSNGGSFPTETDQGNGNNKVEIPGDKLII